MLTRYEQLSDFTDDDIGSTAATHCIAQSLPVSVDAGTTASFSIICKDAAGNCRTDGGDRFEVRLLSIMNSCADNIGRPRTCQRN